MREKIVPAVFLMLVLLIGFPSSVGDFSVFADDDDDNDNGKKENKNLKVSAEESKAYQKQKEKAEEAREKAQERKEKLKEKYDVEIEELKEKTKKQDDNQKEKYERELKKLQEKAQRLEEKDHDEIKEFGEDVYVDLSSKTTSICHFPPGNPDNYHTLTIGTPAARAHVAHGDSIGECEGDHELQLEEREYKLAKKQAKLEEKRYELEQKQIEHAQKLQLKLSQKIEQLELRSQKLIDKFNSGEYFGDLHDDEEHARDFLLDFPILTGESFIDSSTSDFSVKIELTTSSNPSSGHQKFKVISCDISGETNYTCEFGKARSISSGPGKNNAIDIIAFLKDLSGDTSSLRAFVTPADSSKTWFQEGTSNVSMTGKISLQWSLSGDGTMDVIDYSPTENFEIHDEEHDDEVEDEDEIELEGEIHEIDLESQFFTLVDSVLQIFVNENTEFDEGFEGLKDLAPGFHVDVDIILSNGSHVATEIEIEEELDDDDLDDDEDEDDKDDGEEEDD